MGCIGWWRGILSTMLVISIPCLLSFEVPASCVERTLNVPYHTLTGHSSSLHKCLLNYGDEIWRMLEPLEELKEAFQMAYEI